jgi:hypothetical protein
MRTPKHTIMALALVALAALLAACGGGGGEEPTTTASTTTAAPSLTKAELITQGDAICAEVNAAVGSIGAAESSVPNEIEEVSSLYMGMVERLVKLGAPTETAGYSEFIESAENLAKIEGEVKLASEREDTAVIGEKASEAAPALEEFQSQAAIYGFEKCSEGPQAPTPSASTGESSGEGAEEGGVEPEAEVVEPEVEEAAPEEVAPEPEGGGVGGGGGGTAPGAGTESGGSSGGIGPG